MNWKKGAVVCSLLLATGCVEEKIIIRGGWQNWQAVYGEKWPLTRPEGMFHCTKFGGKAGKMHSLTFWSEGYDYHLIPNVKRENGFYPIDLIVKPDPKNPGKKMDTDLVLKEGLTWCEKGYELRGP
jgi:hypothetical protein